MVEGAQGRLRGRKPVSVVDIGSNSVRLVVYEGVVRSPTVLFNEKILCGLGKGIAGSGRLNDKAAADALTALRRFRALSSQAGAAEMHVLATAAAREAANGPQFVSDAEAILGCKIRVLTGAEEAHFSALGIASSVWRPDGIVGDLGGGSLELADIKDKRIGDGVTLPLGGLRLADMAGGSLTKAAKIAQAQLSGAQTMTSGRGRKFYAVGGTWRNLGRLHMETVRYPLHVMHEYEIAADAASLFFTRVARGNTEKIPGIEHISRNRQALLSYGATVLSQIMAQMQPSSIVFSGLGVREGYLYSLLPKDEQGEDPLISAAGEMSVLRARSPEHARELADWTGEAFARLGLEETEEEARYRQAACLLADIGWRAHPDYRGLQSVNIISNGAFIGISHAGRAYMALANFFRHEGLIDDALSPEICKLAPPRLFVRAKLLGALMRVVYLYSAAMPGIIPQLSFGPDGIGGFLFMVPSQIGDLASERTEGRLQQFARLLGKPMRTVVG